MPTIYLTITYNCMLHDDFVKIYGSNNENLKKSYQVRMHRVFAENLLIFGIGALIFTDYITSPEYGCYNNDLKSGIDFVTVYLSDIKRAVQVWRV
uniref:Uncharacterized protein n=1 Tax=Glossina palpalis gambiensis TaxID=67801 RepID=A0A1B0BMD2_9MUSC